MVQKRRCIRFILISTSSMALSACSSGFDLAESQLSEKISSQISCKDFRSRTFDAFYEFLDEQDASPIPSRIKQKLILRLNELPAKNSRAKEELIQESLQLLQALNSETQEQFRLNSALEHLQALIDLEFQNQSTTAHRSMNIRLQTLFSRISSLAQESGIPCENQENNPPPSPPPGQTYWPRAYLGGLWAFATAYQTCQSLSLAPMSESTASVAGVKIGAANGDGFKREYGDIEQIAKTHYYIKGSSFGPGCFDVSEKPLVYDYGGQPKVISSLNLLDFFVNSGTGGEALGVDCSAFVSSALATAGLRYSTDVDNKPIYVRQTSRNFIDPQASNWNCFDRLSFTGDKSIEPGDIMAIGGHVVMIDQVGKDPFGIKSLKSSLDCPSLSVKNFDFIIMQSSPSKKSIGINRYSAKDYLDEAGGMMEEGFLKYAQAACLTRFDGKVRKPTSSSYGIIRHKGTSECLDRRVQLKNEVCIQSCPQLRSLTLGP